MYNFKAFTSGRVHTSLTFTR